MYIQKETPLEDPSVDLLSKFEAVEIKAEQRISEDDRVFCKAHQAAYDDAKTSLMELSMMRIIIPNESILRKTIDLSITNFGSLFLCG